MFFRLCSNTFTFNPATLYQTTADNIKQQRLPSLNQGRSRTDISLRSNYSTHQW